MKEFWKTGIALLLAGGLFAFYWFVERKQEPKPADLAFLAMAYLRLGQKEQATATLERLRQAIRKLNGEQPGLFGERDQIEEAWAFLREAEALLQESVERPKG